MQTHTSAFLLLDIQAHLVPLQQQEALSLVGRIEEDMVDGFPFDVPKQYADRPLLKGRATVDMPGGKPSIP